VVAEARQQLPPAQEAQGVVQQGQAEDDGDDIAAQQAGQAMGAAAFAQRQRADVRRQAEQGERQQPSRDGRNSGGWRARIDG
jgi:hypothetical protein